MKTNSKYLLGLFLMLFLACKQSGVKKPAKLIEEEKMVDILYDLSILDAIISTNPAVLEDNGIDMHTYIYKKHKIDSLQFVENNTYYASDFKKYKKMYEAVEKRIDDNKKAADSLLKKKQQEDNKKAEEFRLQNQDSLKKGRSMKETKTFLKK